MRGASSNAGGGEGGAGKEQTFLDFGQRSLGQRVSLIVVCLRAFVDEEDVLATAWLFASVVPRGGRLHI